MRLSTAAFIAALLCGLVFFDGTSEGASPADRMGLLLGAFFLGLGIYLFNRKR